MSSQDPIRRWRGQKVGIHIVDQDAEVRAMLGPELVRATDVPANVNTLTLRVELPDGRYAVVVNQTGFTADDREVAGDEVNGRTLLIYHYPDREEAEAYKALELYVDMLLR